MTDFDARAREITNALMDTRCDAEDDAIIAAALKAAYNEGLEDAATECDDKATALRSAANDGRCDFVTGIAKGDAYAQAARSARAKMLPT